MVGVEKLHIEKMDKLTIAITGSSGFIAKHLADRFIVDGHKVAGVPRELLTDPEALKEYFTQLKPHYIFHFATYGNMHSHKEEDEIFMANIVKTYMLLQATKDVEYKGFVNVSTSSVYGKKTTVMHERDVLDTDTLYGVTKAGAEGLCRYFAHEYDKPIVTARPFSVIGIGEQEDHLIPKLIRYAFNGKKMDFVAEPTHDYISVVDVVDALLTLSLFASDHKGQVFNIGRGEYFTNLQVKEAIEEITGKRIKTKDLPSMRKYDSSLWVSDPTKLKMLGWFPTKEIRETLEDMVKDYERTTGKTQ